jgi:hypothetical protein
MAASLLSQDHDFARRFVAMEQAVQMLLRTGPLNNGQLTADATLYLNAAAGSGGNVVLNPDTGGAVQVNGNLTVTGAQTVSGTKSFLMDHPTDPSLSLQHAATESPVNGVEYWGSGVLDATGQTVVALPAYFEALTDIASRAVLVTPQYVAPAPVTNPDGTVTTPPYTAPALACDPVQGGQFTVYGPAGTGFWWLVKAARVRIDPATGVDSLAFSPVQPKFVPLAAAPPAPEPS